MTAMDRDTVPDVRLMDLRDYEGSVRKTLLTLGSNNPDGDLTYSGKFWEHCRNAGIAPEVCAATIYSGIRHRHTGDMTSAQTATLREVAEGVAEEELLTWKEHGGGDWSAPGLGGTYRLYPKPEGGFTAEFDQHGTAAVKLGSFATFGAAAAACRRHSDENSSQQKHAAEAAEPVAVIHESGRIPWRKVARDPAQHEADMKLAEKHGPVRTPKQVYELVGAELAKEDSEIFLVIPLNVRGELKSAPYEVARGQRSRVSVDAADVLRAALDSGAEGFICCHSHPTGKARPSKADIDLTKNLKAATKPYGKSLCMLDHVVIGHGEYFSIFEDKLYKVR